MASKRSSRLRRAIKTRKRIANTSTHKLCVIRSSNHIRVQLISLEERQHKVLAEASTLEKDMLEAKANKTEKATLVGKRIAKKAKEAGINKVAFDRSGYPYHGRVKALAEAAREGGLDF